jgi:hypothetical protein
VRKHEKTSFLRRRFELNPKICPDRLGTNVRNGVLIKKETFCFLCRLTLCRKGLVLRASQKYSYAKDGSGHEAFDPKMHLTNTKINAGAETAPFSWSRFYTFKNDH